MERGSDKHAPELDDALKQEFEPIERSGQDPRIEEARRSEGPTEGEDVLDLVDATPGVASRTDLARFIQPSVFPADREALIASARTEQAPEEILSALERLPEGRAFDDVTAVWEALESPE